MFNVCSSSKNCPFARCASAANVVCRAIDIFGNKLFLLIIFYNLYVLIIKILIVLSIHLCV
jgi:hypothetical protein